MVLLSQLRGRCSCCGQKLNGNRSASERVSDLNRRAEHLTVILGRRPLAQNCQECQKIIFETECGFVQRYLLVDIV